MKLYNRPFWAGFVITIVGFVLANIISFWNAEVYKGIFNDIESRANWGFPFPFWGYSNWIFEDGSVGLFMNFVCAFTTAFVVGLLGRLFFTRRVS